MFLLFLIALTVVSLSRSENEDFQLPVFDFYQLLQEFHQNDAHGVMNRMDSAAQTLGVFMVQNISKNLLHYPVEGIIESANRLFQLSTGSKMQTVFNSTHHFGRGYLSFGAESGLSSYFEPKEGYSYGFPSLQENDYGWLTSSNLWPDDFPYDNQEVLESVHVDFGFLAQTIVSALLHHRSMQYKDNIKLSLIGGEKISLMRLFHYFKVTREEHEASSKPFLGSSPHTDWGLLTVILQNGVSGLQFYHQNRWIDVPNLPDAVIINIGDYFSLATDGLYHSPIHRVLCPEAQDRLSFVYFYYPSFESKLIRPNRDLTCQTDGNGEESPSCQQITREGADQRMEFNTLTVREDQIAAETEDDSFGEYIMYKWRSVLRQQH